MGDIAFFSVCVRQGRGGGAEVLRGGRMGSRMMAVWARGG